jgi:hypothetical protein
LSARGKYGAAFYPVSALPELELDQHSIRSGSGGALVVSKWGHRAILLELFKIAHKGNFSRICNVSSVQRRIIVRILVL